MTINRSQRFARLEAMLLAMSFSVPLEPIRQISNTIVTTERPFIHPVVSFTGTSSVQTTGGVTQSASSQLLTSTNSVQDTGPVSSLLMFPV